MIAVTTEGKSIKVEPGAQLAGTRLVSITVEHSDVGDTRFARWFTEFVVPRLVPKP